MVRILQILQIRQILQILRSKWTMALDYRGQYQKYRRHYLDLAQVYRERREVKVFVDLAFAILAVVFFTVFAIKPTLVTIAGLLSEIRSQEEVNQRLETKISSLRQAHTVYSEILPRLTVLDEGAPELPLVSRFLRQLEALSGEWGVDLSNLSFETVGLTADAVSPQGEEKFLAAKFLLNVAGGFDQLNLWLTKLEELRRIAVVENYAYTSSQAASELSLSVGGGVLFFPQIEPKLVTLPQAGEEVLEPHL